MEDKDISEEFVCSNCGLHKKDGVLCLCDLHQGVTPSEEQINDIFNEYFEAGKKSTEEGDFDKAKSFLLKAISLKPENQEVIEILKKTEGKLKNQHFDRLVSEGKELMERDHFGGAKAKLEMALIFKKDEEIEKIVEDLKKKVGEEEFRLLKEEGVRFYEAGALKEAEECLNKALILLEDSEVEALHHKLQDILERVHHIQEEAQQIAEEGKWSQALKHLEKGFTIYPEDNDLLVTAAFFTSHRDEYKTIWREGRSMESKFRFFSAWIHYQTLLSFCPQDKVVRIRMYWILFKLFVVSILCSLGTAWGVLKFF